MVTLVKRQLWDIIVRLLKGLNAPCSIQSIIQTMWLLIFITVTKKTLSCLLKCATLFFVGHFLGLVFSPLVLTKSLITQDLISTVLSLKNAVNITLNLWFQFGILIRH